MINKGTVSSFPLKDHETNEKLEPEASGNFKVETEPVWTQLRAHPEPGLVVSKGHQSTGSYSRVQPRAI